MLLFLIAVCTPIRISLPIFLALGSLKGLYHKFIFTTNIFRSRFQLCFGCLTFEVLPCKPLIPAPTAYCAEETGEFIGYPCSHQSSEGTDYHCGEAG